jgi:hypothetical protein
MVIERGREKEVPASACILFGCFLYWIHIFVILILFPSLPFSLVLLLVICILMRFSCRSFRVVSRLVPSSESGVMSGFCSLDYFFVLLTC